MCPVLNFHPPEGSRLTVPLTELAPGELEELVLWLPGSWLGARTLVRGAARRASRGADRGASRRASKGGSRGSSRGASRVQRSLQRRGVFVAEVRGERTAIVRSWS